MQSASEDFKTMVAALRTVLQSPQDAGHPGRLRMRLESGLGADEARRLRRYVWQVVAAAEDNLPVNLRRIAPLTAESLQRLSDELATSRGWTPEAARRTTQIWAYALGFEELAASSWPREPLPSRPQPAAPPSHVDVERTAPPPQAAAASAAAMPQPEPAALTWPKTPKAFRRHTHAQTGEPALGVVMAYSGMNAVVFAVAVTVLLVVLCAPIVLIGATGVLLPVLGTLIASFLVRRLGKGALVATEAGVEFTPYDNSVRNPRTQEAFRAPWAEVTVEPGLVSRLRFANRTVQVGPRNKAFVEAVQRYAGQGR